MACGDIHWWRGFKGEDTDFVGLLQRHGQAEHLVVQFDFLVQPTRMACAEYSIPGASKTRNGATGYADIVSLASQQIWEIKPHSLEKDAVREAAWYVKNAQVSCGPQWKPGADYTTQDNKGIVFVFEGNGNRAELHAWQGPPGAILYQWEINGRKVPFPNKFYGWAIRAEIVRRYFGKAIERLPNALPEPFDLPPIKWKPPVWANGLFDQLGMPGIDRLKILIKKAVSAMYLEVPDGGAVAVALEWEVVSAMVGSLRVAQTMSLFQVKPDPTVDLYRKTLFAFSSVVGLPGLIAAGYVISAATALGIAVLVEFAAAAATAAAATSSTVVASMAASIRAAQVAALAAGAGLFAFVIPRASHANPSEPVSSRASFAMYKVLTPDEVRQKRLGDRINIDGKDGILIALMGTPTI